MQPMQPPTRKHFGTFDVDLATGELRRDGLKLKLQEKPFQLLAMLLERPGEIVTREALRERLWPAGTFVDFDHGLNTATKKLRTRSATVLKIRGSSRRSRGEATGSSRRLSSTPATPARTSRRSSRVACCSRVAVLSCSVLLQLLVVAVAIVAVIVVSRQPAEAPIETSARASGRPAVREPGFAGRRLLCRRHHR